MANTAVSENTQLSSATTPPDRLVTTTHRTLSVFKARQIKRSAITRFCNGQLSQTAVDELFTLFPELRSA